MGSLILLSIVIFVIFGLLNAFIANVKGFNPVIWFFAAGFLGLIVLAILPSANKVEEDTEKYEKRRRIANYWGIGILAFAAVMIAIQIISSL